MGVLEDGNITNRHLNKIEAFSVLLYSEAAKKLNVPIGNFDFYKSFDGLYDFSFDNDLHNAGIVSDIDTFIHDNFAFTCLQGDEPKDLSRLCKSLMGIEAYLRRLYPDRITYNSSRRILRYITKVVALDYLLGNSTHTALNTLIYSSDGKNYDLCKPTAYAKLFQDNPGINLVVNLKCNETFKTALRKFEETNCKNNTFDYFKDNLLDYTALFDDIDFKNFIFSVCDSYRVYLQKEEVEKLNDGYKRQRKFIKDELYF